MSPHEPFERRAADYDRWYDTPEGGCAFAAEVEALRAVAGIISGRWLEVGVGTGRFAAGLGIGEGIDPSPRMLALALRRGIGCVTGAAEKLPFPSDTFDGILLALTLCFVDDPGKALAECRRVLHKRGRLLVGIIPADGPWGAHYLRMAEQGHPVYSVARFILSGDIVPLVESAGFRLLKSASTLETGGARREDRSAGEHAPWVVDEDSIDVAGVTLRRRLGAEHQPRDLLGRLLLQGEDGV